MATQITKITVPLAVKLFSGSLAGTITISVYEGGPEPQAVTTPAEQTKSVNVSDLPITTSTSDDWEDHNINESQWTDFVLNTPITVNPTMKNYVIGMSFSGITNSEAVFICGTKAAVFQFERYDFVGGAWESSVSSPDQYFSCRLYDGNTKIGEVTNDGSFVGVIWNEGTAYFYSTRYSPYTSIGETNIGYYAQIGSAPVKATTPTPSNAATDVSNDTTSLKWTPGDGEESDYYEVYMDNGDGLLGDEPFAVVYTAEAVIGLTLQANVGYTWRVDSVNSYGTTTGDEWTFTTSSTPFYTPVLTENFVWFSAIGDYENFEEGVNDADSFATSIQSSNEILWIEALNGIIVGTASDEWVIKSDNIESPLTPTKYSVQRKTSYGSAKIQPIVVHETVLCVNYTKRKLLELFIDSEYGGFKVVDLTELAENVTTGLIKGVFLQKNPDNCVWLYLEDGTLISLMYNRNQEIVAWSKHPAQADSEFMSGCVLPSSNEDQVWFAVKRTINESEVAYIEVLQPRELTDLSSSFFVDSGIVDTGTSNTITGLDHLEGETVFALVDGAYDGEFTVTGGSITLNTTPASKTIVGLSYASILKPMRIVSNGPDGTSLTAETRISELKVVFQNTLGARYGNDADNLFDIDFSDSRWENTELISGLFTGDVDVSMPNGISRQNPIIIENSKPFPMNIKGLVPNMEKTGR